DLHRTDETGYHGPGIQGSSMIRLAVLAGDGIGPEIAAAAVQVLERLDRRLELGLQLSHHAVGFGTLKSAGPTFPAGGMTACREADGIILGPVSTADYPARDQGGVNISSELRRTLDLYANIRPSRSRAGLAHYGRTPMDLVIVRENTEGFYAD